MLKKLLVVFLLLLVCCSVTKAAQPPAGWQANAYFGIQGQMIEIVYLGSGPNFIMYYLNWPTQSGGFDHFPVLVQPIPNIHSYAATAAYLYRLSLSLYGDYPCPYPN
jgi:hypothetical protein